MVVVAASVSMDREPTALVKMPAIERAMVAEADHLQRVLVLTAAVVHRWVVVMVAFLVVVVVKFLLAPDLQAAAGMELYVLSGDQAVLSLQH